MNLSVMVLINPKKKCTKIVLKTSFSLSHMNLSAYVLLQPKKNNARSLIYIRIAGYTSIFADCITLKKNIVVSLKLR